MSQSLIPPFCPNSACEFHLPGRSKRFWHKNGFVDRPASGQDSPPHRIQRFKCKRCAKNFSTSCFGLNYRFKHRDPALNHNIFHTLLLGASNRQIARYLKISPHCVLLRIKRMSQWALLIHRHKLEGLKCLAEPIVYDGLENFAGSQFDVNNIHQAIGRDSLFLYDFNFAPLNRKGRTSNRQKIKKETIEDLDGPYPRSAIRWATTSLLKRLLRLQPMGNPLDLCTDEHFQYKRSIQRDLPQDRIHHVTVSSKATRNFQNILFAVNHSDLMSRSHLAAFSRETISFSKTHARMCQKFMLFAVHKNYLAPQFTKKHIRRPKAHCQSPAQAVGLETKILKFHEFFNQLKTPAQVPLPEDWALFYNDQVPYPRIKRKSA